jgi:2-polyprenyl-3-methyl-5-hydroxy-6-metoxy-1,4-benzoquinol methylase
MRDILDAGCGPESIRRDRKLAPQRCEVIGIDTSEEMVRAADERAKRSSPARCAT